MCWNPKEFEGPAPVAAADPALCVFEIQRKDQTLALFNIAGHPVVLGKESNHVSADWPGAACRQLAAGAHPIQAAFIHGAGADAHPYLATDNCPSDLEKVAAPVASMIQLVVASGKPAKPETRLRVKEQAVQLAKKSVKIAAWRIGPLRVLAVPGELFGESGQQLRAHCDGPLIIATTSNGWTGYLPPERIITEGAYETDDLDRFSIQSGDTETLISAALKLLTSI